MKKMRKAIEEKKWTVAIKDFYENSISIKILRVQKKIMIRTNGNYHPLSSILPVTVF